MESVRRTIEWVEVTVGPVIGRVTETTARVLIEFKEVDLRYHTQGLSNPNWLKTENEDPKLNNPHQEKYVTCFLFAENSYYHRQERRPLKVNIPMVFQFEGLKTGTKYSVQLDCSLPVEKSSFWTLGRKPKGILHAGIVSCNEISIQEGKNLKRPDRTDDLWADLGVTIESHELDYVFHIGDQVYMDMEGDSKRKHIYDLCCRILKDTGGFVSPDVEEEILEIIRGQYRRAWRNPSIAFVLANVPNLMICDDHEFRDDWGFRDEDSTPKTLDYFYGQLARQVYYEYQRQLRDDIPWDNLKILGCEYHDHILNGVGVSFMEYRGCRSWFQEEELKETHIGNTQSRWIKNLFRHKGEFDKADVRSALFISPIPLFFLTQFLSKLAYLKSDDIQEYWTYASVPQLSELLDLLRDWKRRETGRELLIVAGDCHLGGWTEVLYRGESLFRQFVTSAINNKPAGRIAKGVLDVAMKLGKLNENYTFLHHNWKRENNYGIVIVNPLRNAYPIQSSLVWYSEEQQDMMIKCPKPSIE